METELQVFAIRRTDDLPAIVFGVQDQRLMDDRVFDRHAGVCDRRTGRGQKLDDRCAWND